MENIVNSPTHGQLEAISQVQELVLDLKGAMSFTCELWRGFISQEVGCFEPNQIPNLKTRVLVRPFIIHPFRNLLRLFNCVLAFLLCFMNLPDPFVGFTRLTSTQDIH